MRSDAVVAFALSVTLAGASVTRAEGDLVIAGARVIDGTGRDLGVRGVAIRAGRFVERIGAGETLTLDASGMVATPGLIDARSGAGLASWPNEEGAEVTPALRALDFADASDAGFAMALRGGVTSVVLSPGPRAVIGGLAGALKTDGRAVASRVLSRDVALSMTLGNEPAIGNRATHWQTPRGVHFRRPGNRMGVVAAIRQAFASTKRAPATPDARILDRVRRGELPVLVRARSEAEIEAALTLASELGFSAILVEATEAHRLVPSLAASGVEGVLLGPSYNSPRTTMELWEGADVRHATPALLHAAGVKVALDTGILDDPGGLRDSAILAVRHGLPREAALAAITSVPAELLGLSTRVGDIAPGLDGDVVLWSGDPLDLATRVRAVIVEGRVVWSDDDLGWLPSPVPRASP